MRCRWYRWMEAPPLSLRTVGGLLVFFLVIVSIQSGALLPLVAKNHGWEAEQASVMVASFAIGILVALPFAGGMFDRSRRMTLLVSVIGNLVCAVGYCIAPVTMGWFFPIRLFHGIFFGIGVVSLSSTISRGMQDRERNLGQGVLTALSPLAWILIEVGSGIYNHFSDRVMLLFFALLALLAVALTWVILPEESDGQVPKRSWWPLVEPTAVLPALLPALLLLLTNAPITSVVNYWLVAGLAGGGLFVILAVVETVADTLQGFLSSKYTYKVIFGGILLYITGMFILVFSPHLYALAAVFIAVSCGPAQARVFVLVVKIVPDSSRRGQVMGTSQLMMNLGGLIGGLSGWAGEELGYFPLWGGLTLICLGLAIVIMLRIRRRYPSPLSP